MFGLPFVRGPLFPECEEEDVERVFLEAWVSRWISGEKSSELDFGIAGPLKPGLSRSGNSDPVSAATLEFVSTGAGGLLFVARTPPIRSNCPVGAGRASRCAFSCSYFSPVLRSLMPFWRQSCNWEMA